MVNTMCNLPSVCVCFFFCWWNACCLPPTMLCFLPFALLSYLIDCVSFSVLAVGDRCWVLLSVAVRVCSRDLVQHSSDSLIDTVLRGGRGGGGGQIPVLTSVKKNWGGKLILQWCACCGGIVISPFFFKYQRHHLPNPTSWFTNLFNCLSTKWSNVTGFLFSHTLFTGCKHVFMPAYTNQTQCIHTVWKWRERGSYNTVDAQRGGENNKVTIYGISR